MGKFTNTDMVDIIDSSIDSFKDRLQNPYYKFDQSHGNPVDYYNVDLANSTYDEVTGLTNGAADGSYVYREIKDFIIYGLNRIQVSIENGEEGREATEISDDAMILPCSGMQPVPGDHFIIKYSSNRVLYKVTDVQQDTLDNGANAYKITYLLISSDPSYIDKFKENVKKNCTFIIDNVGTEYRAIITDGEYELVKELDDIAFKLRHLYKSIFYSDRVQSLIMVDNEKRYYDKYLTKFVMDSGVLQDQDDFLYIDQKLRLEPEFEINYNRSFYQALLEKKKKKLSIIPTFCYGVMIDSKISIFYTRPEDYYSVVYERGAVYPHLQGVTFDPFDSVLIDKINSSDYTDLDVLKRVIVKYFNNIDLTKEDMEDIEDVDLMNNIELFYIVPCALYCLEKYIKKIMKGSAEV